MTDFSGHQGDSSSSSYAPVQRGPKACNNCRRRKIKCDAARPICNQCRIRPPRSKEPCDYPRPEGQFGETPAAMIETITALRARVEELEYLAAPDPTRVYLNQPYSSRTQDILDLRGLSLGGSTPSPMQMQEPPPGTITTFVDTFLSSFLQSGLFFLDATRFRHGVLLPLPFGHRERPSPALLSVVYLWGSILSASHVSTPVNPYTPDAFLACVLQNIPQDLLNATANANPNLLLDTIQAEVLLSFYFLHCANPVAGRVHASCAASLALGAGLHLNSIQTPGQPPFPLFGPAVDAADRTVCIGAFWTVVIVNSFWVGVEGSPSAVPYGINVDTPWPGASQASANATISKFLNGSDSHGTSAVALLAKASILLERIVAFSSRSGPPDPTALSTLDRRLHTFQAALPPLPGAQILIITHALVDLAIVRLHAPFSRTSESARRNCLNSAARICAGAGAVSVLDLDGARSVNPMLGPIYAAATSVYIAELTMRSHSQGNRSPRTQEMETRLSTLMSTMASLAAYSPLIERCFVDMRTAYTAMSG